MSAVVGPRAVVLVLLLVMLATGVVVVWPEDGLPRLAASAPDEAPEPAAPPGTGRGGLAAPSGRVPAGAEPGALAATARPAAEERARLAPRITDLADDGIPGNACRALDELWDPAARPMLYEALGARDWQQRLLAGFALARSDAPPTPKLAEVLVETLTEENDGRLWGTLACSAATMATRYLYTRPAHAQAALRRALWTGDAQQRFLAAFLLGCDGSHEDLQQIVRELIGHLADNDTESDGMMAAHALFRLGRRIEPVLRYWLPHVDAQAQQFVRLILLDLADPPITKEQFHARQRLHRVTSIYFDPIVEFDPWRSPIAKN
jgi:hypothetical protein